MDWAVGVTWWKDGGEPRNASRVPEPGHKGPGGRAGGLENRRLGWDAAVYMYPSRRSVSSPPPSALS